MFLMLPPFSISQSLTVVSSLEEARTFESSRQLTSVMNAGMAAEVVELAAGLGLPDDQAVVAVAGGEQDAVGAELDGRDPLGVLAHLEGERAVGRVVDPDDLARTAERDLAVVGADVGRQHDVVFLADLEDARALLDVPGDRQPRLAAAPAAGQEQVAVAAELQDVDQPLGERQDADQVVVGRPVEQHLLVPGDRDQRRPGARRHRHDGAGLGLRHERLGRDSPRASPAGPPACPAPPGRA